MIKTFLTEVPEQGWAFIMAFVMAALRVYMDKSETRLIRILMESLICGGLTLAAASLISAVGLDHNYVIAAGGMIGFLGANSIRAIALKIASKKSI